VATPYLEMFGDVVYGMLLVHSAAIAQKLLDAAVADAGCSVDELCDKNEAAKFWYNKVISAQFFAHEVLPNIHARAAAIAHGHRAPIHAKF